MFFRFFGSGLFNQQIMSANARQYGLETKAFVFEVAENRKTSHEGWFFLKKSDFEGKTKVLAFIKILKQSLVFVKIKSQKIEQILRSWLF